MRTRRRIRLLATTLAALTWATLASPALAMHGSPAPVDDVAPAFSDLTALGPFDALFFTHRHADHLDVQLVDEALDRGIEVIGNADVAEVLGDRPVTVLDDGATATLAGWQVRARDIPHVVMVDGSAGPQNTGVLFDDRFLHPGDGLEVDGLDVDVLALPIAGPSISFHDAWRAVQRVAPSTVVPIHYDVFVADPAMFASRCDLARILVLADGESAEV